MKRICRALAFMMAALSLAAGGSAVGAADPEPGTITVTVKDAQTNAPLSGIKVDLRSGRSSGDAYTGDDGIAHLQSDQEQSSYFQIRGTAEGFCPVSWTLNERGGGGKPPAAITLLMEKAVGIGGAVVDQEGKPLGGAKLLCTVEKKYADPHQHLSASWISVTADSDGKWTLPGVPATFDTANIAAYHRDCLTAEGYLQPKPFSDVAGLKNGTAQVKLTRGLPVTLVVHGTDGSPVRNARIDFGSNRGSVNDYPEEKVDATGTLTLGIAPGAETVITITAKGRAPELVRPVVTDKAQTINITLQAGNLLQGTVIDGNGDPASTGQVSIESWRGVQTLHPRMRIDGEGKFTWPDAPADEMKVSVWTGSEQKNDIVVKAGQDNVIKLPAPTSFKGIVVDAASGQPVTDFKVMAGLRWDLNQAMSWHPTDETGTEIESDGGSFVATLRQNYPWRAFRVVADGYLPADSAPFQMDGKEVAFTFKLEKGKPLAGKLLNVGGQPLATATVMLILPGSPMQITNGKLEEWALRSATVATTGADGTFTLPPQRDEYLLVAITDDGFAECGKADFEKKAEVTLQPWGKVQGVVKRGTKIDPGAEVLGWMNRGYAENKPSMQWNFNATADAAGKFSFDKVPTADISFGRKLEVASGGWTQTDIVPVKVAAGETKAIQIGGVGRPVVGHVTIPPDVAAAGFAFFNSMLNPTKGGVGQQFVVKSDGSFRVEDVAEGSYNLQLTVTDLSKPNEWMKGVQIGNVHKIFTMPAVPGGVSDEPLDIGTLSLTRTAMAGAKAPEIAVKTLDGTDWKLSAQSGKVVVLDFWSAVYSPTTALQPKVAALWDTHGKDPHFAIIGLSLGDDKGEATRKFVTQHDVHWPTAALGRDRQPLLEDFPMQGIPTFWIISPEGTVVGQNVKANQLEALVAQQLKTIK